MEITSSLATGHPLLQLDALGEDVFRSSRTQDNYTGAVFGGQPFGQSLAAAHRTVPGWPAHQIGGYFLRPGNAELPIDYEVQRLSDSRRFALRRVSARQNGRLIFEATASFHDPEDGHEHRMSAPAGIPGPDGLENLNDYGLNRADQMPKWILAYLRRAFPIEIRPVDPHAMFFEHLDRAEIDFWFRMREPIALAGQADHQALLAFMSDYWISSTPMSTHRTLVTPSSPAVSSIGHSIWFHGPVAADQWLLYRTDSPWAGEGRGVARGLIHDVEGRLVATVVQEVIMRGRAVQGSTP